MPKYICLSSVIDRIIISSTKDKTYKGPNIQVEYDIDWENTYQITQHRKSEYIEKNPFDEYGNGFLTNQDKYPLNDEPLILNYEYYRDNFVKITDLKIYNTEGWDTNYRCRDGYDHNNKYFIQDEKEYALKSKNINKKWYLNYSDSYSISKENITLNDIANGVFAVKSGKLDHYYENFTTAYCKVETKSYKNNLKENEVCLDIILNFEHGS